MQFLTTVMVAAMVAARAVCLSGAVAAAFVAPSYAGSASSEPGAAAATQELNLTDLEQRVRDTRAISVFQKLALQTEVDELLARFRNAHARKGEIAALRRPYERLLANIQSHLRQDPQLAHEIASSREAIWEVLTDRARFASL